MNGIQVRKIDCKTDNHIPLVVPGVPSTEHQTKAVGERKQAQVVGDHERSVQKEKYQYGFNHSRMDWQGDLQVRQTYLQRTWNTTAKTSSLRASSGEAYFEQSREKTQFIHSLSERPGFRNMQTHESYESAMQKKSWRSGGQNNKNCQKIWWYDNSRPQSSHWRSRVEISSRICRSCARLVDSMNSTSSMQNRISTEDDEKSRKFLHSEEYLRSIYTDKCLEFVYSLRRAWLEPWKILQNEQNDEWRKAPCQYWFSMDCKKAGVQTQWSIRAIFQICKTYLQIATHLANVGPIHHWKDRSFLLEQK